MNFDIGTSMNTIIMNTMQHIPYHKTIAHNPSNPWMLTWAAARARRRGPTWRTPRPWRTRPPAGAPRPRGSWPAQPPTSCRAETDRGDLGGDINYISLSIRIWGNWSISFPLAGAYSLFGSLKHQKLGLLGNVNRKKHTSKAGAASPIYLLGIKITISIKSPLSFCYTWKIT